MNQLFLRSWFLALTQWKSQLVAEVIVGIGFNYLLQRCVSMCAARYSEPERGVLANLLRIIGGDEAIERGVGRDIGMLGNCIECASTQVSIPVLRHERAQICDALFWIGSRHERHRNAAGIDRAVFAEQTNAADLLVFHSIEQGNALDFDIIAIVA